MSSDVLNWELKFQPSILLLAQQGDCRAIAQWLNTYLAPQGIAARVTLERPRCLRVVVEFSHVPNQSRLVRFICHRLCKLNSRLFNTVRILAQYAGTALTLWEQTVRLSSPAVAPLRSPSPDAALAPIPPAAAALAGASPLPPRLTLRHFPTPPWLDAPQLILFKNPLLLAAAMLAFCVGAGLDVGGDPSPGQASSGQRRVTLPIFHRANQVKTAGGSVPVTTMTDLADPTDPDVTLVFSNPTLLEATDPIPELAEADVTLAHLDAPILPPGRNGDRPTASGLTVEQLHRQGVDLVSTANEPLLQRNRAAFANTLRSLEQANIPTVGSGLNRRAARQPEIVEVKGERIAYLGYGETEMAAGPWSMGVNPALEDQIAADLHAIRDQVDWVVVTYRWNQDLADYPATWQVRLAHFAVDQGADLVVGYHPTVLQGAEVYRGRAIAYSLGDFIYTDTRTATTTLNTAALEVSLRQGQMKLEFLPVQVRQHGPTLAQGRSGRAVLRYIEQASGLFDHPLKAPMILDRRDRPDPSQPSESEASDSFITYPDGDGDSGDGSAAGWPAQGGN